MKKRDQYVVEYHAKTRDEQEEYNKCASRSGECRTNSYCECKLRSNKVHLIYGLIEEYLLVELIRAFNEDRRIAASRFVRIVDACKPASRSRLCFIVSLVEISMFLVSLENQCNEFVVVFNMTFA